MGGCTAHCRCRCVAACDGVRERAQASTDWHSRAGQVSVRAGNRGAERQEVAHRARVFPSARRRLSPESVPRAREARGRRHVSRRRHARGFRPRD